MTNVKILRKRVALIAATALGVGLLVATPANATSSLPTLSGAATATVLVGHVATTNTAMGFTASGSSDNATISAALTKPTASVRTASDVTFGPGTALTLGTFSSPTLTSSAGGAVSATVPVNFTPDVPGTYVVTLTNTAGSTETQAFTITAPQLAYKTGSVVAASPFSTGAGVAGPANTTTVTAYTLTGGANQRALVTVSGAGATVQSGGTVAAGGASSVVAAGASADLVISTPTVGTITVNLYNETGSASGIYDAAADATVTISVSGTAQSGSISAANSTEVLNTGTGTTATGADAVVVADKAVAGAPAAQIVVTLKDVLNAAMSGALTVSLSGPGSLGVGASGVSATGRSFTGAVLSSPQYVTVWADGTPGVATITLSVGSTVLGTKTVTFTGPIATLVATKGSAIYMVGANAAAVTVLAKDAAGNALAGKTVFASSGTTNVATIPAAAVTGSTGIATFPLIGVASGSSVLTFGDAATTPAASTTATVTVGLSTASAITLSLDSATYAPGAKVVLTLTAKDANGNLMADATYALLTSAGLVASTAITGLPAPSASVTLSGGTAIWNLYAPLTAGPFSINGTTAAAGGAVNTPAASLPLTAAASVVASTTVDAGTAANAAAVAALQATVATLATTIASLVAAITAQIAALSALIKKAMAKKVIKKPVAKKKPATKKH